MKVSAMIQNMIPYKPGKPISEAQREYGLSQVYKLASNENPLGPSPKALHAIQQALKTLHLYPDPTHFDLLENFSKKWQISKKNLSFGNGSDEVIDLLVRIFCEPDDCILTCQAAFSAYEISAQASRVRYHKTPLTKDFRMDLDATANYFLQNPQQKIRLIFIANPNNPTGTYVTQDEVQKFFEKVGNRDDVLIIFY